MIDESRPTSIPGVATFHRREAWQDPALPVTGPNPTMDEWDTFPLHYTAADDLIDGDPGESADDLPAYLRAIQRDYKLNRGYSIGYGFAVDWLGGVWELRGYDIKNAANRNWNHRTGPVLCLVDGADPLTDEAIASVNALYAEGERRCERSLDLAGHRDIGATACPGDGIYNQIQAGLIYPDTGDNDDMKYLTKMDRVLDTRGSGTKLTPGSTWTVALGMATQHAVRVTVVNGEGESGRGFVSIAGTPDGAANPVVNLWNHVEGDGVAFLSTPNGHGYLSTTVKCDVIVDVMGRG